MSMTKRYLESLPEEQQNEILGEPVEDTGEYEDEFDRWIPDFNEADCGGVFDGYGVISDADPGL